MPDLFYVTTRRTYTDSYRKKWPASAVDSDTTRPRFADSEEEIRAAFGPDHFSHKPPWSSDFSDDVVAIERADEEKLAAERARAVAQSILGRERYRPCCDLAVLYPCVCSISYLCPVHGQSCHGSHD